MLLNLRILDLRLHILIEFGLGGLSFPSIRKIILDILMPLSLVRCVLDPCHTLDILEVHIDDGDIENPDEDQPMLFFFKRYKRYFAEMGRRLSCGKVKKLIIHVTRDISDNEYTSTLR